MTREPTSDESDAEKAQAERSATRPTPPTGIEEVRVFRGTGLYWSLILGTLLGAAIVILVAQNTEEVTVSWLAWEVGVPLAAVILAAMLVAVLLASLVSLIWRFRRRRVLGEHEELRRLRKRLKQ